MRRTMTRTRKKGTPVSELGRDMYGFIVRPQHLQRYREFASIYKEEEAERSERWENFLRTYNDPALSSDSAINKPGVQSNGEVDFALEKQDSEAGKPRTIQRWAELRASLNIVEQGVTNQYRRRKSGKHDGNEILSAGQEHDNNAESVKARKVSNEGSGDESDDEFYDPDGMNDSASDNESSPFTGQDCPWREELQFLVRGGVPMALRGELWQVFVGAKTRRVEGHYDVLLTQSSSNSNGNGHSQSDSLAAVPALEKWANQIEKDLPRTFPGHPALDEDGRNALRRLLTAYARHNPDVGYCQAMNFFAALLLLLMPEENAFWTLTGIIDDYFEGYYSEKLLEAQVDQLVFEELAREYFPKLISHLDALGVQIGWICGPWFLSIFVNVLPWESVLRVWDVLLFEGNRTMLFRTALALMDLHAPALMASRDAGDAIALMQTKACATFDSSQLVLTACMGFQKIDEQQLDLLRVKHRPVVLATLHERALELQLWRSSQGALAKKLSRKYSTKGSLSITSEVESGSAMTRDGPVSTRSVNLLVNGSSHDVNNGLSSHLVCPEDLMHNQDEISIMDEEDEEDLEEKDVTDLQEQVAWLKEELCHALEDKKRAMTRAEELELALMEMVKEDNRRELSAKVEKLESEFATLQQTLSEKQEQEKAMVQVLLRMEQEQKVTEDARRFAEQDAAAQRHAANALQEKYEQAMENLAAMEKRKVMAETMLEATLQYEAGQPGNSRRAAKEEEPSKWTWLSSPRSSDVTAPKSKPSSPADPVKPTDAQDEPVARKQGLFSRINWLERNKTKSTSTSSAAASPDHSTQAPESLESNGLLAEGSLEGFDGDNAVSEGAHEIRNAEMSV